MYVKCTTQEYFIMTLSVILTTDCQPRNRIYWMNAPAVENVWFSNHSSCICFQWASGEYLLFLSNKSHGAIYPHQFKINNPRRETLSWLTFKTRKCNCQYHYVFKLSCDLENWSGSSKLVWKWKARRRLSSGKVSTILLKQS